MVSSTTYSMVSTLAGLKKLEAQIYRALAEVGPEAASPKQPAKAEAAAIQEDAHHTVARANSILSSANLDVRA